MTTQGNLLSAEQALASHRSSPRQAPNRRLDSRVAVVTVEHRMRTPFSDSREP